MSKIIIGVHGLSNKVAKDTLEDWWKKSILEGLNINLDKQDCEIKFKMVYWADLLYEEPLNQNINDKRHALYISEPYITRDVNYIAEDSPIRKKILDYLQDKLDDILLKDDLSSNYSLITDKIVERKFNDLTVYYSNEKIRNAVRERLATELKNHKKDEILLLSHSMGTIIAYEVFSFSCPDIEIDTFVSMGSPLGFPLIKARIAREFNIKKKSDMILKTPENIGKYWFNLSDIDDTVALDYKLSNDYVANSSNVSVVDFQVHNDYTANGERNPHKAFGYLRTPELSNIVYKFIQTTHIPLTAKIIRTMNKIFRRLRKLINN